MYKVTFENFKPKSLVKVLLKNDNNKRLEKTV